MMKLVAQIGAIAGVISLASSSANADCAFWGLAAKVATPAKTSLTGGGGILVYADPVVDAPLTDNDVAMDAKFTLRDGSTPKKTKIAPGLVVYEMPFVDQSTPVELFDGKKVVGSVIGDKSKVAQFPAPKLKSIALYERRHMMHSSDTIEMELDGDLPADVWGVVIVDAKGKARAWNAIDPKDKKVVVYNRWDCRALPNGTVPSKIGEKVSVFFVNAHGRTSDRTQLMTIKRGAKP
jgi:hypothetical protein